MRRLDDEPDATIAASLAKWLRLAAAPTFALMALLTALVGGGDMAMICRSGPASLSLGGMAPMYLLMSAFHSPPWLKLMAGGKI
jgi:hypothetical protein